MSARDVEAGRAHVIIALRDKVSGALKHVERSVSGFGRSFASLGAAVSAGSGAALAFPLKLAADMERTGIGFEVMLGSAEASKQMLKDLAAFARSTPFTLDDASKNAQMLLAYGVSANNVIPSLKALGDVSLGDQEKFNRLTLAFGQTMAKGRLMGQEVLQMTEAGFNPLQEISRTTGISVAALSKKMEAGEISAQMLAGAFASATGPGGRFHNGMEKLQKSAWGMMSTLMDAVAFGLRPIGDAAIAVLKPVVSFATNVADAFGAFAETKSVVDQGDRGHVDRFVCAGGGVGWDRHGRDGAGYGGWRPGDGLGHGGGGADGRIQSNGRADRCPGFGGCHVSFSDCLCLWCSRILFCAAD